jgi:predicted Fe-Mo cluster-binding NifX family protein
MKSELIAIPTFQERVSPLLDVSDRYAIYETENGEIKQKVRITVSCDSDARRIERLREIGVDTIICGAVSGHIAHIINERGMRLISMAYGPLDEIIGAYLRNALFPCRTGPAVCGRRQRRKRSPRSGAAGQPKPTKEKEQ